MKKLLVLRDKISKDQALGSFYVFENDILLFKCESIERGWVDNRRNISCVPEGVYDLELEYSNRFKKDLWELKGVPNRSECKIHAANFARQLNGCIALGEKRTDIDRDGKLDVTNSRNTMDAFHKVMGGDKRAKIRITSIIL